MSFYSCLANICNEIKFTDDSEYVKYFLPKLICFLLASTFIVRHVFFHLCMNQGHSSLCMHVTTSTLNDQSSVTKRTGSPKTDGMASTEP